MKSNSYISTPQHNMKYTNYLEDAFGSDQLWQKRARKLRERRWLKQANKIIASDSKKVGRMNSRDPGY